MVETVEEVWRQADMILKVKEPIPSEYEHLGDGQILFTYLHLAASKELTEILLHRKVSAVAYETVQLADGRLPPPAWRPRWSCSTRAWTSSGSSTRSTRVAS
jgi:alanine dehydrogenase